MAQAIEIAPGVKLKDDGTVEMSGVENLRLPDGSILLNDGTVITQDGETQSQLSDDASKDLLKTLYAELSSRGAQSSPGGPATPTARPQSAADAIAAGPPPARDPNAPAPIGVPEGFTAPRRTGVTTGPDPLRVRFGTQTRQVKPRYFDAHLLRPYNWSPGRVRQMQDDLVSAGLLTGEYRPGVYDAGTQGALEQLLGFANASGRTMDEAAGFLSEHTDMALGFGGGLPETVVVTDPETVKLLVRRTTEELGLPKRAITPEIEQQIIDNIHGQQRQAQTTTAGEVVQPDITAQVTKALEERFGAQIDLAETQDEVAAQRQGFMTNLLALDRVVGGA